MMRPAWPDLDRRLTGVCYVCPGTKYEFIADLTLTAGNPVLDKFQVNTFLMGVMTEPASFAWEYLAEYMHEDND